MRDQVHPDIIGGIQSIITPKDVIRNAPYFEARLPNQNGYGTNDLDNFIDLDNHIAKYRLFKCIEVIPGSLYPFRCEYIDDLGERFYYECFQFFLPADMIRKGGKVEQEKPKEPKARPFTIAEFKRQFDPRLPCFICYRLKDISGPISSVIIGQITAYKYLPDDDDSLEIVLSGMSSAIPLKARWLFDHVEWSPSGDLIDWRPFGVEGVQV